jgi:ubiquinone/menaquinone biosynthesis C-methylase UbiE
VRLLERFQEWRVDRLTDRLARRPSGRSARKTYGADDAHAFLWEPVLDALALEPDDRLLDVGCGGGAFLRHVRATAGCEATGLDHSSAMVRLARSKSPELRIVQADAAAAPFTDGEFTVLSCLVAFFFFPNPLQALREFRRVLDPERGRLAVMTTAPEAKGTEAAPYPLATRGYFYTDDELVGLAREAGFSSARMVWREPWAQLLFATA